MSKKRHLENENVIESFMSYAKIKDIAQATGLSEKTVSRYKDDPEFQKILSERKTEYVKAAVNKMQSVLIECVDTLMDIIRSEETKPQTKVNAIQIMFSQCRDWTQSADVLERLRDITEDDENY